MTRNRLFAHVFLLWFVKAAAAFFLTTTRSTKITSSRPSLFNHQQDYDTAFPSSLIRSLDLIPLMQLIAENADTKRGYMALMSLIQQPPKEEVWKTSNQPSRRQQWMTNGLSTTPINSKNEKKSLLKIAKSRQEAKDEYQLVQEATHALESGIVPPFYSTTKTEETLDDYDEWLELTVPEQFTMQNILQAEQILNSIRNVHEWSFEQKEELPHLAKFGLEIDPQDSLPDCLSNIANTVEILRVSTLTDPTGSGTYTFRLKGEAFPILQLLRDKLDDLKQRGAKEWNQKVIELEQELAEKEAEIQIGLAQHILQASNTIDSALDQLAKLDVVFSKAAFGKTNSGVIPIFGEELIHIQGFLHPLLSKAVPMDLSLKKQALVITGPNGGGKTLGLKSFGVACVFSKLGVPIPVLDAAAPPRVNFCDEILVHIGDPQNIQQGESTFTGMLQACASILDSVSRETSNSNKLILLDELGSGTDPEAGGAMAVAIMEEFLDQHNNCHVVATTHAPRLKAASFTNPKMECAAVLLSPSSDDNDNENKLPTFRMQYGVIGESYAMGAASRISNPPLPESLLQRASQHYLLANDDSTIATQNQYLDALTQSLQKQVDLASNERLQMQETARDMKNCRAAMMSLAASYQQELTRLETKLEDYYKKLQDESVKNDFELLGDTLATLRLVKKQVLGQEEYLKQRGLKALPLSYELQVGESVVILSPDELDGSTVKVVGTTNTDSTLDPNQVMVEPTNNWFGGTEWGDDEALMFDDYATKRSDDTSTAFVVSRLALASWDYESAWDDDDYTVSPTSTTDSKRRLNSLLSTLKNSTPDVKPKPGASSSSTFTSTRERKAAAKKTKQAKKKGKQKRR